jgi:hypothetical protein
MGVTLNDEGSSPVVMARWLSIAAVAAKDQHDPHPPWFGTVGLTFPSFAQSTSVGRLDTSSMWKVGGFFRCKASSEIVKKYK